MRCLLPLLVLVVSTAAHASEPQHVQRAREELERQLEQLVRSPPPELELLFEALAVQDYELERAEFLLDGQPVAFLEGAAVKGPGPHRLASLPMQEGLHTLVSRITYKNTTWNPLDEAAGYVWKMVATLGFQAQRGLRVRVKAVPALEPEETLKRRLKLSHEVEAELLAPAAESLLAESLPPPTEPLRPAAPAPASAVAAAGAEVEVAPPARAVERRARLRVQVLSGGNPVVASVSVRGDSAPALTMAADEEGWPLALRPGRYTVDVIAPEHLAQTRWLQLGEGVESLQSFELEREPKRRRARLAEGRLELQPPLGFRERHSLPSPEQVALVREIVDVLVRGRIERLRVEGHADGREAPDSAQALSEARARAVAGLLEDAGLEPSRLEVLGAGDSRPLAPNLTPRGRQLNRRVELTILGGSAP